MAVVTQVVGSPGAVTVTGLSTLASATYVASATIPCNEKNQAIEVNAATTNTPAGNKKLDVFVQESLDGTTFRSGPTSGTTTTREKNLKFVDSLPIELASTTETLTFDIESILGYIPKEFKVILKNDLGVALTSGTVRVSAITPTIT